MNQVKINKCKESLQTLYSIFTSSDELANKFSLIRAYIILILENISNGNAEDVKMLSAQLKDEILEYNDDEQNLKVKTATKTFANALSKIERKDCNDLNNDLTADFTQAEYEFWTSPQNENSEEERATDESDSSSETNSETSQQSNSQQYNQWQYSQQQSAQQYTQQNYYNNAGDNDGGSKEKSTSCWGCFGKFIVAVVLVWSIFTFAPALWSLVHPKDIRCNIAESGVLRSAPNMEASSILETLGYGCKLQCEDDDDGWVKVKNVKLKGYMAAQLLASKEDYAILSSIFGGIDTSKEIDAVRGMILEIKYRRALVNYFKQNSMMGVIDDTYAEIYGVDLSKIDKNNYWKITKRAKGSDYDNALHDEADDLLAVIIDNINNGKRKTLVFGKGDNSCAQFLYSEDAPEGVGLRSIQPSGDSFVIKYASNKAKKNTSSKSKKSAKKSKNTNIRRNANAESYEETDPSKGGFRLIPLE